MAAQTINWRPGTGKALPINTPIRVDPKFKTIGLPGADNGYIPFDEPGNNKAYYRVSETGTVTFKFGPKDASIIDILSGNTYNTLNDLAASTTGNKISNKNFYRVTLQGKLETRAPQLGIRPTATQPAPPTPNLNSQRNSPDTADPGPNSPTSQDTNISTFSKVLEGLQTSPKVAGDYGRWKYPEELNANQDRIYIEQITYVTPDIASSGSAFAGALSNRENQFATDTKVKILGSVTLPMTNRLTESVEVGWGESRLSSIAAGLMAGGVKIASDLSTANFTDATGTGAQLLGQIFGDNAGIKTRAAQYLSTKAAAEIIGKVGFQINPEEYITRRTGTVPNPNLELLFNGPKLKSFGLSFKLTPRSSDEAHQIRNIIKFFKKGMAPLRGSDQESSFFLGTPNIFRVKFKPADSTKNELLSLPQFKTCALVRCEVDYTPDGIYAAYEDSRAGGSQPIAVTLQLGFAELTPIYNNDYELPSETNNSVGPDRSLFEEPAFNVVDTSRTSPPPSPQPNAPSPAQINQAGGSQLRRQLNPPITPAIPGGIPTPGSLPGA